MGELRALEDQIKAMELDKTHIKQELPELQKQIEIDRRKLAEEERTLPQLKSKLARVQADKLKLKNQLDVAQKTLQDGLRKSTLGH